MSSVWPNRAASHSGDDRWTTSRAVPRKGEDAHAIEVVAKGSELSGYTDFICKSDGEPSIKALNASLGELSRMQRVEQHGLSHVGTSEVKPMQGRGGRFSGSDPQHHGMRAVLAGTCRGRGVALDA